MASVVCDCHSCIIPPLAALVVCFDLFGREQDLSAAYSRERQSPDLTSYTNKASLDYSQIRHVQSFTTVFVIVVNDANCSKYYAKHSKNQTKFTKTRKWRLLLVVLSSTKDVSSSGSSTKFDC